MIEKSKLLNIINGLPDSIDVSELLDRILLLDKIEMSLVQEEKGDLLTTDEAKIKLKKWLR